MATATDYLPEAVGGYLRLPREFADNRPVDRGKSSLMVLIDQLDLLASTMDKVFDAVCRADAAALVAHGRFLQEKFGAASTGGSLDVGSAPLPPMPADARRTEDTASLRLQPPGRETLMAAARPPAPSRSARPLDALVAVGDGRRGRRRGPPAPRAWRSPPRSPSPPPGLRADWADAAGGGTHPGLLRRRQPRTPVAGRPHRDPQLAGRRRARRTPRRYARSLAEVASAACQLGEPTMRVIGNASVAAAAQLGRRRPATGCPGRRRAAPRSRRRRRAGHAGNGAGSRSRTERRGHAGAPAVPEKSLDELLAELDAPDRPGAGQARGPPPGRAAARGEAARRGRA